MNVLRYLKTEVKLLLRGPGSWLMAACLGGLIFLLLQSTAASPDKAGYILSMVDTYMNVAIIIFPLLATAVARRDQELKTAAMLASFPYRFWQLETARILCAAIMPVAAALVPAAGYAILLLKDSQGWGLQQWHTVGVLASFAIPMLCAVAIAYLIGSLIRKRYSYLVSFFVLIVLSAVPRPAFVSNLNPHQLLYLDYSLSSVMNDFYSSLWGVTYEPVFWLHRIIVLALVAVLTIIALLLAARRRMEPARIKGGLALAILLPVVVAVWAAVQLYGELEQRVAIADETEHFYGQQLTIANYPLEQRLLEQRFISGVLAGDYTEADIPQLAVITEPEDTTDTLEADERSGSTQVMGVQNVNPLTVSHMRSLYEGLAYRNLAITDYKLKVDVQQQHRLRVEAKMEASYSEGEALDKFPIVLRHSFEIQQARINDMPASFVQEEGTDVWWLTPAEPVMPGTSLQLAVDYEGIVNDWRHRYFVRWYGENEGKVTDVLKQFAIVSEDRLLLPAAYGWYPVIGNSRLSEININSFFQNSQSHNVNDTHFAGPLASFHVEITAPVKLNVFSNAEQVAASTDVSANGRHSFQLTAKKASGLGLVGGSNVQLAEANVEGKTLRLVLSGEILQKYAQQAAEMAARQYAVMTTVLEQLDGEQAMRLPEQATFVLADYPFSSIGFGDAEVIGAGESKKYGDLHFIPYDSVTMLGFENSDLANWEIATYLLNFSNKEMEQMQYFEQDGRLELLNKLNSFVRAYVQEKVAQMPASTDLFKEDSHMFKGSLHPVYKLMNRIYSLHGLEGVLEAIVLYYKGMDDDKLGLDGDEWAQQLLQHFLDTHASGR